MRTDLQTDTSRPRSLRVGVWSLNATALGTAAWIATELAYGIFSRDAITRMIRESDPTAPVSEIHAFYRVFLIGGLTTAVLGVTFWLWLSWKSWQGRGWPRVVVAVVVVINAPGLLLWALLPDSTLAGMVVRSILVTAMVVALVALWRDSASRHISAVAVERHRARLRR